MTWNHRIVRHTCKGYVDSSNPETNLEMQEVFYHDDGSARGHGHVSLHADTVEEMKLVADRVRRACEFPAVDCMCDRKEESA
jgi:hypothetical protein